MQREVTYIDDIVEGVIRIQDVIPTGEILYNNGNNQSIVLSLSITAIETVTGKTAEKIYMDKQPGNVKRAYPDIDRLEAAVGYKPATSIEEEIESIKIPNPLKKPCVALWAYPIFVKKQRYNPKEIISKIIDATRKHLRK